MRIKCLFGLHGLFLFLILETGSRCERIQLLSKQYPPVPGKILVVFLQIANYLSSNTLAMRLLTCLFFILLTISVHAQSTAKKFIDSAYAELKAKNKTDKTDREVFLLLENFYTEVLQSDQGELSEETAKKINSISQGEMKNRHLMLLFLMYQQHISETAMVGKRPDTAFQVACIQLLENEMKIIYNRVPTIVTIYKAEALENAGRKMEANAVVAAGLKENPKSVPLKVYCYLGTRDENIKIDLVKNHPTHWMVQQFGIK